MLFIVFIAQTPNPELCLTPLCQWTCKYSCFIKEPHKSQVEQILQCSKILFQGRIPKETSQSQEGAVEFAGQNLAPIKRDGMWSPSWIFWSKPKNHTSKKTV